MATHIDTDSTTMDQERHTGDQFPHEHTASSMRADDASDALDTPQASLRAEKVTPKVIETWPSWLRQQWYEAEALRQQRENRQPWKKRITSRVGLLTIAIVLLVGVAGYGIGANLGKSTAGASGASAASSMAGMDMSTTTSSSQHTNVPNATQAYGSQTATYTFDKDGAKHFTFTAEQVMWEVVKGHRVLAWTLDGTVPGPTIHVTAGDHVRITIINHFPEATAIHWHGLEVPMSADGVPPLGMEAIKPNTSYTYDFTIRDEDAGTHWYHSHYDDMTQVGGGLYGAFVIDARPGSPEAKTVIHADVEYTAFLAHMDGYYLISGKAFPDTLPLKIKHGQTVHIMVFGADTMMIHPLHLHGHTFSIVAEDGHPLAQPILKDTVQVGPGDTYDLTFYAWGKKGDIYPLHCHILSHVMNPGQTGAEMGGMIVAVEYVA